MFNGSIYYLLYLHILHFYLVRQIITRLQNIQHFANAKFKFIFLTLYINYAELLIHPHPCLKIDSEGEVDVTKRLSQIPYLFKVEGNEVSIDKNDKIENFLH